MKALEFENVFFSYTEGGEGNLPYAVRALSFAVEEGQFVSIIGHNGSGKSTLARLCNGLLQPTSGKITVFGQNTADASKLFEIRKNTGIVFQNPDNQMVASIVEDDIAFGPENIGLPRNEIGERIEFSLHAVGMTDFRKATPSRLSGGQKQRIAIAGVLAIKPKIIILDESTAMLDPKGRREVGEVVRKLNRVEKITVIQITHYMEETLDSDRVIVLNKGEIVMDSVPSDVFARGEELEGYNLGLPKASLIAQKLNKGGMSVGQPLDIDRLAVNICESFQKN